MDKGEHCTRWTIIAVGGDPQHGIRRLNTGVAEPPADLAPVGRGDRAALENGIQICSLAIGSPGKSRLPLHTNPAAAILLAEAVAQAKAYVTAAIAAADRLHVGGGAGPLHHFHEYW